MQKEGFVSVAANLNRKRESNTMMLARRRSISNFPKYYLRYVLAPMGTLSAAITEMVDRTTRGPLEERVQHRR